MKAQTTTRKVWARRNARKCDCGDIYNCFICRHRKAVRKWTERKRAGLVKPQGRAGRPITCECGECKKCRDRIYVREYRKRIKERRFRVLG